MGSHEFVPQRFRLLRISAVEAFRKPAVDGHWQLAGLIALDLVLLEPSQLHQYA